LAVKNTGENVQNLFEGDKQRDFYVLIDPDNFLAINNMKVGSFTSLHPQPGLDNLLFLPNPLCTGFISPFQSNLLLKYLAEFNFEISRRRYFPQYPSRLEAVFLFETEEEVQKYISRFEKEVSSRILKKVKTVGSYHYSTHDSSWVDFCRLSGMKNPYTTDNLGKAYWSGEKVENCKLEHFGNPWSENPIFEVLYYGRVDF
jgi:Protein of unknown function (DUF2441)